MNHAAEIIECVEALASLVESDAKVPAMQARRDKATASGNRKIQKLVRDRLRKQRTSVLSSSALAKLHAAINRSIPARALEADRQVTAEDRDRISAEVAAALSADVHGVPVTDAEQTAFSSAITQAVVSGDAGVSALLSSTPGDTESFISEYLKDGGFTRLTGQIDKTTVDRLASAVADTYEKGASFDETVSAIRGEFADMTQYRAKMIAQTELNDAYNQSIFHFGTAAGATRKSWETDLAPCVVCIENAMAGEVEINSDFPSGDDAPPAHPNCLCSLLVHADN